MKGNRRFAIAARAGRWCARNGARARVRRDRIGQRRAVEVRPVFVGEVELGVRELPQQEIADALLAAGADEEIGLRRIGHRQVWRERFLGHVDLAAFAHGLGDELLGRLQDVPAAAVVRGDRQRQARVARGLGFGAADQVADARLEAIEIADHPQADAVRMQLADSRSSAVMNSRIRNDTSSFGRRQFSELNANSVRYRRRRAHSLRPPTARRPRRGCARPRAASGVRLPSGRCRP
jgi:hypothetical protein